MFIILYKVNMRKNVPSSNDPDTCIIVPVYNEASKIARVISDLSLVNAVIICVDDGSTDTSAKIIQKSNVILIQHAFNMGQGAALQTGFDFGLQNNFSYFLTFDADGQHQPDDAKNLINAIKNSNKDVIFGSRFLEKTSNTPIAKSLLLKIATKYTNLMYNSKLTDTHNGLRIFTKKALQKIRIEQCGMGHASEIIRKTVAYHLEYDEIPVYINYSQYSRKKGQKMINSINILIENSLSKWI